ncbi:hypothetical protein Q7453_02275 [Glaesserella parasuis]|nr:hypothetical protein [Glaesserella parasuis]MDO9895318.1 hypothetical protein [Glaesserella parasuis]
MDFITCNAFVVFSTENGYTLSLSPINIRKDKILYVDLASVISEFGEFNKLRKAKSREPAKFHILSGEIQGEFTKLTFDEEYFKLICKMYLILLRVMYFHFLMIIKILAQLL